MKNVLLLGDSICISYREKVKQMLQGKAEVFYPEENCRWSGYMYNTLRYWLPNFPNPDIIHFNSGIWECVHLYGESEPFYTTEDYVRDVMRVYRELCKTGAKIIFATTTPILKHERLYDSEVQRNIDAIVPCLKAEGCEIDDLNSVVRTDMQRFILPDDGCHLTDDGSSVCAKAVCRAIEPYLD